MTFTCATTFMCTEMHLYSMCLVVNAPNIGTVFGINARKKITVNHLGAQCNRSWAMPLVGPTAHYIAWFLVA